MNELMDKQEYRVLARKYRPQKFSDLIGQQVLVQTLTNAIQNNRIAHAYLLSGVRGIGKTTTARLIAMSLNCESRNANSHEPCGNCESCKSIRDDRNMDVIEMDAASKTGVDDIREIIDNIKYKPVNCKYKIFIIDEVHMLSKSAFNALLKTLEEPPEHIKFIFATTESRKIPITIISRCQRFDLHRVSNNDLNAHIDLIAKKEKIEINQDAISLIVRSSDGSIRDGLSLLDQAIASENEKITAKSIIQMLGLADRSKIFELLNSIFKGDAPKSLFIFNELYNSGADILMIFDEMLKVTHFLTKLKISPEIKDDLQLPEQERKIGFEISEKISISSLGIIWQVLFKGFQELQSGFNLHQLGEILIIRLIYLYDGPNPEDLIRKLEKDTEKNNLDSKLEKNTQSKSENIPIVNNNKDIVENHDSSRIGNLSIKSYRQLVDLFYQKKEGMLYTYLYNNVKIISFKEGELTINADSIKDPHFVRTVAKFISKWTGRIWQVTSSSSNIGKTLYEEDLINQQKEIEIMKNDIEIKELLNKFEDVKIHSITEISETADEITIDNAKKIKEK